MYKVVVNKVEPSCKFFIVKTLTKVEYNRFAPFLLTPGKSLPEEIFLFKAFGCANDEVVDDSDSW